jgi:hypothetical protein
MRQSIRQDATEALRSIEAAKRAAPLAAERVLKREMLRGQRTIMRNYRSLSAPGPQGTAVRTGRLRSSYTQRVTRSGPEVVGELGLFNLGILPVYFEKWEGQLADNPGRPAGGALEAVRPGITSRLETALEREISAAVGAS